MPITILNNGASIQVQNGTQVRNIMKAQIIEVSVIKTNVIKIDIGQGALHNVFIPYADVTNPVTPTPADLRDAINDFLAPAVAGAGNATEARQIQEIDALGNINASVTTIKNLVTTIDSKMFIEPRRVDDGGVGIIYKGYSALGIAEGDPLWAIQKIENVAGVDIYTWADGDKNFDNIWQNRESLVYA